MDNGEGPKPPSRDTAPNGDPTIMLPVNLKDSGIEVSGSQEGMLIEKIPAGSQIVAPLEGNVSFEYKNSDKQADGSLSRGKVSIKSKDGVNITMEADNIQLLVGLSTPTAISEDGIVRSSQEIVVKNGEPLFTIKNQSAELHLNASQGAPTSGSTSV